MLTINILNQKDQLSDVLQNSYSEIFHKVYTEEAIQRCSVGVLKICSKFTGEHPCRSAISIAIAICECDWKATLLKSHFGIGVLQQICCIFSKHLFSRTPLNGCFCLQENVGNTLRRFVDVCLQLCFKKGIYQRYFFGKPAYFHRIEFFTEYAVGTASITRTLYFWCSNARLTVHQNT